MIRTLLRSSLAGVTLTALAAAACGETSGSVLERIPEQEALDSGTPTLPSNLEVDVYIVRSIESCAVGEPCRDDPDMRDDNCFELEFENGTRVGFHANSLEFVPPEDERCGVGQSQVFEIQMDDQEYADAKQAFLDLENGVYVLSDKEVVLDIDFIDVPSLSAGFVSVDNEWGFYLPANGLPANALPLSRETDFNFAVTGFRDRERGLEPRVERCAGTVRDLEDGFAGAGYTWVTTECDEYHTLVRHWMFQVGVALRDANNFNDAYDGNYPHCGEATTDPKAWFPDPDDCSVDPDAPTCGENRCEGSDDEFVAHVLGAHWPGRWFVGNRCNNDEADFDETGVDEGGACDGLGR
jgi:hypothetical protein